MSGILAYGCHIPLHRLGPASKGWTSAGEKAVASFDEDSITMAVAAVLDCLGTRDRNQVDGLYFATTTPPYDEKLCGAVVAAAADLRRDIFVADIGNSLRSATIALRSALDAVKAGTLRNALVVAADLRVASPRSELDTVFGDGAAALLVGGDGVAVEIEDSFTTVDNILDLWRVEGDAFVRNSEDRFALERGLFKVLPEAVSALLAKNNLQPSEVSKVVLSGPTVWRKVQDVATRMGFDGRQLQDGLVNATGNTGSASPLIALAAALADAKAGDRILVGSYGNGADALLLRVTENITGVGDRGRLARSLASKQLMPDYESYLRWRGIGIPAGGARRPTPAMPSPQALRREEDAILRYHGCRCLACGTVLFPPQRICSQCHTRDNFEPVRLSDTPANLFTYSMDYLQPTPQPPNIICVLNFQGGGRSVAVMTDRDPAKVAIGMPLEMTFRKLVTVGGITNYYWKCMPVREHAGE